MSDFKGGWGMTAFKGTPGPWSVELDEYQVREGEFADLYYVIDRPAANGDSRHIARVGHEGDIENPKANAYLLAASWDLLNALMAFGQRHDFITTLVGKRERWYTCWCGFGSESTNPADHDLRCNAARVAVVNALATERVVLEQDGSARKVGGK